MKIVVLLAGQGNRFGGLTKNNHKSLISINSSYNTLKYLSYCLRGIKFTELVFILGHCNKILEKKIKVYFKKDKTKIKFVLVKNYKISNNLNSMYCAKNFLKDNDFLIINGDTIFPPSFIINMIKNKNSNISIQYSQNTIEAPKVFLQKKNLILIDRYSKKMGNTNLKFKGFMTGLLFINKKLSNFYFKKANLLLKKDQDSVFYDPLIGVSKNDLDFTYQAGIWTDFDEIKEKSKVKLILETILKLKKFNYLF
jgi:choline kinase